MIPKRVGRHKGFASSEGVIGHGKSPNKGVMQAHSLNIHGQKNRLYQDHPLVEDYLYPYFYQAFSTWGPSLRSRHVHERDLG